ncbi:MAG: transcriptional regulator NrdR [Acidimicrobiia bacterium]|nr:MAG: transcriptional regulator NrdR [Acidimicrobiia bacterium]
MRCPYCAADDTRVVDSRPIDAGSAIRRRRACEACGNRFTTYERRQAALMVRKRDGRLEAFDPEKVRSGVVAALADRQPGPGAVDDLVAAAEAFAEARGPLVESVDIGHLVLDELRRLDEVAYLRFASVYKDFEGAEDFGREVAALEDPSRG